MTVPAKKTMTARTKRYLVAPGPQLRFIVFLLTLLIAYTVLLRVFQKLAQMLDLPVFLPLAMIALLVFVALAGVWYSHKFLGPLGRIKRAVEKWSRGDTSVELRLRESDDPLLTDLANALNAVCERRRNADLMIKDSAGELFSARTRLARLIKEGASYDEISRSIDDLGEKEKLLDKAIQSLMKA